MHDKLPTVGFVSLGCPKNLVDSERILTQLRAEGYTFSPSYDDVDLVIVNTCGFIDAAVEESLDAIGEAIDANGRVIVTGCLGKRADEIRAAHPEVLEITGAHAYEDVMQAVHKHLPQAENPFVDLLPAQGIKLTPSHYAYLKISEGCNHRCRFCIIPSMRGDLVSRPMGEVLAEAERLVDVGVRELLVVAQDTSAYGVDLRYRTDIVKGKPLQAMRRPAATEKVLQRIQRWREECPELTLRSTFIVGFPGETEDDFDELLEFIQTAQLDRVGCFAYSPVEGAAANELPDPVPEEVKQDRLQHFMEIQAQISRDRLAMQVGREMLVLVDEVQEDKIIARGPGDAPEVDGNVFIEGAWEDVAAGDFIQVQITAYDEHDLYAEPL